MIKDISFYDLCDLIKHTFNEVNLVKGLPASYLRKFEELNKLKIKRDEDEDGFYDSYKLVFDTLAQQTLFLIKYSDVFKRKEVTN